MRAGATAHHIKSFRPSLLAMQSLGIAAEECLKGTGLSEDDLDSPSGTCTWDQELRFNQNLLELADDPCLGLKLARSYHLPTYGLFGYAILSAPTFRHAMTVLESYVDLTYTVCNFYLKVEEEQASLLIKAKYPIPEKLRTMLLDRDLGCCFVGFSEALGESIKFDSVSVTHDGHNRQLDYEIFFDCPVEFGANEYRLSFDVSWLDRPLPMRDFQANNVFDQQCQLMLARLKDQGSFIQEIRQKILSKPGHSFPDIDTIANQLNVSVRTLRRRLSDEGTTYRHIVDDIRFDLAKDYLSQSRLSLDMISELLGYHDAASFSHAFKRWSGGQTPSTWRKQSTM